MSDKPSNLGDCEFCEETQVEVKQTKLGLMCAFCLGKDVAPQTTELSRSQVEVQVEVQTSEVEVQPSTSPMRDRLQKAYLDEYNKVVVSGMTHEQIKYRIADLEDMIKVLQTQVQAAMDVDDEYSKSLTSAQREMLRNKDRAYRAKARPATNADGTLKISKPAKPKQDVAEGNKAYENLVEKIMRAGKTREQAEQLLKGMMK